MQDEITPRGLAIAHKSILRGEREANEDLSLLTMPMRPMRPTDEKMSHMLRHHLLFQNHSSIDLEYSQPSKIAVCRSQAAVSPRRPTTALAIV